MALLEEGGARMKTKLYVGVSILLLVVISLMVGVRTHALSWKPMGKWKVTQLSTCRNVTSSRDVIIYSDQTYICDKIARLRIFSNELVVCYQWWRGMGYWFRANQIALTPYRSEKNAFEVHAQVRRILTHTTVISKCNAENVYEWKKHGEKKVIRLNMTDIAKCKITGAGTVQCDSYQDGNGDGRCQSGETCIECRIIRDTLKCSYRGSSPHTRGDELIWKGRKEVRME